MLELEHISKSFYRNVAIDNVSLKVKNGEVFGLLGPNGAGKTTLIRIINQILEADKGVVRYKGEMMKASHLKRIGYLPEERGLYRNMTVEDHALFLGRIRGLKRPEVKKSLDYWVDKFNIGDWRKKRIEELSKGMAQKVQFMCTVLHEPDLLILDEPFSGFDPINVELIKQELIEMKAQDKTIILSTHNMNSVEEICDRVALIHESKKILDGTLTEVREERRKGHYAIRFQGNMLVFANALWTGYELLDKEILGDDRFIAYVKMRGENELNDLLSVLITQLKIEAAWEVLPSMQEIFIDLVTKEEEVEDEK